MSSFEWMELQSLTADIAEARARLAEARSLKDNRLIRTLEQEITAAEAQRAKIVLQLSTHFADHGEGAGAARPEELAQMDVADGASPDAMPLSDLAGGLPSDAEHNEDDRDNNPPIARHDEDEPMADRLAPDESDASVSPETEERVADPPRPEPKNQIAGKSHLSAGTAPAKTTLSRSNTRGGNAVWDQLTPGDLDRAKEELDARRTEMLARHAEELKALDADSDQLEMLEQAIAAFLQKFNTSDADVVKLGDERELRANRA